MKFVNLIKSHSWLSIELTLIKLYPNQEDLVEEYRNVFEKLGILQPILNDMLIVLTEYEEEDHSYVDISGRKLDDDDSYALEFTKWEEWLGMELASETMKNFNGLEIISHCLHEMTFFGYEETEIQEQFQSIQNTVDEYRSLSDEEKGKRTISLEELMKKLDKENPTEGNE